MAIESDEIWIEANSPQPWCFAATAQVDSDKENVCLPRKRPLESWWSVARWPEVHEDDLCKVMARVIPLVMTNIAMENPPTKWWFLAGKIIYKWAIFHGYVK